jgi:hypothetical protein
MSKMGLQDETNMLDNIMSPRECLKTEDQDTGLTQAIRNYLALCTRMAVVQLHGRLLSHR